MDKQYLSWQHVETLSDQLSQQLRHHSFDKILCVTRGGMNVAMQIAYTLNITWIDTVCIASYENQQQGQLTVCKQPASDLGRVLVIDELADTGATLRKIREIVPQAHIATLMAKPQGKPFVDTYIQDIAQKTWIYFPWEY